MFVVDGGYLSWAYGTSPQGITAWGTHGRRKYGKKAGALILIDSHDHPARIEFYPHYKGERKAKKETSPARLLKSERVEYLVSEIILEDPTLLLFTWPGLEADDLVALMALRGDGAHPLRVVGVDKDLLQLPAHRLQMEKTDGTQVVLANYRKKLPLAVQSYIKTPQDVLLGLCLMGDSSDSIPRLIPPYQLGIAQRLMGYDPTRRFVECYQTFGEEFLRNLYLAVLPGPWCYREQPTPIDLLLMVQEGCWGQGELREDLSDGLEAVIEAGQPYWGPTGELSSSLPIAQSTPMAASRKEEEIDDEW